MKRLWGLRSLRRWDAWGEGTETSREAAEGVGST